MWRNLLLATLITALTPSLYSVQPVAQEGTREGVIIGNVEDFLGAESAERARHV